MGPYEVGAYVYLKVFSRDFSPYILLVFLLLMDLNTDELGAQDLEFLVVVLVVLHSHFWLFFKPTREIVIEIRSHIKYSK